MNACVHSLLDGIIDYAGLFPPAELSMDEAFRRFTEHRSSDDGWMLRVSFAQPHVYPNCRR